MKGDMESLTLQFVLYGSKNESTSTDTVFFLLSEVSEVGISLCELSLSGYSQETKHFTAYSLLVKLLKLKII